MAVDDLVLAMQSRLTLNSWWSSCLSLPSAKNLGVFAAMLDFSMAISPPFSPSFIVNQQCFYLSYLSIFYQLFESFI